MKEYRTYAMYTDHDYHGRVIETSRVEVYISGDLTWTPEMMRGLERAAEQRLHSLAKRMPHRYWAEIGKATP